MNINFDAHPGFSAYALLLMFSGLAMVLVGSPVVRRQRPLSRVLNVVLGVGFFGYGFYLAFVFDGGHYVIFFQAFIVPVVLIVRALAGSRRRSSAPATGQWQTPTQQPYPAATPTWQPPAQPGPAQSAPAQWPSGQSWPAESHPIADVRPGPESDRG